MSRKRGINVLNDKLQEEFGFIKKTKTDSDVRCNICNAEFSIAHSGRTDITLHMNSAKHKNALQAISSSGSVTNFFKKSTPSKSDLHIALFDQFIYVKKYVTAEKIQSWEENSIAIDQRWVESFQHFSNNHIPYNHMLKIVSYILCLAGTSAAVERLFSLISEIWSVDKTQLKISTLKNILYTRYNIKLNCTEFFELLKSQLKLLEKIASTEKYAFKSRESTSKQ